MYSISLLAKEGNIFSDFVYLIQEMCGNCIVLALIPHNYDASARLLNQIKEIRVTKLLDLPFVFRFKHITSLKNHIFACTRRELALLVWSNFCGPVCFDLLVERFSFSGVTNRVEFKVSIEVTVAIVLENLSMLFYLPSSFISS